MSFFVPFITMLISLATVLLVWIVGKGVANGSVQVGDIMAVVGYAAQILMAFSMTAMLVTAIPRRQTSAKRIYEILDMPLSIAEPETTKKAGQSGLAFEGVDFKYPGAQRKTLDNINFEMAKGQTLAII